jgi:hypothetical protein
MKYIGAFLLVLIGGVMLAGCGGSLTGMSPFAGQYQGSFNSSNTSDQGTVSLDIDENGNVSGNLVDNAGSPSTTESIQGTISDNGDFTGQLSDNVGDSPFGGNLGFDTAGDLSGPVNITVSGTGVINASFSLSPVGTPKRVGKRAVPTTTVTGKRSAAILR